MPCDRLGKPSLTEAEPIDLVREGQTVGKNLQDGGEEKDQDEIDDADDDIALDAEVIRVGGDGGRHVKLGQADHVQDGGILDVDDQFVADGGKDVPDRLGKDDAIERARLGKPQGPRRLGLPLVHAVEAGLDVLRHVGARVDADDDQAAEHIAVEDASDVSGWGEIGPDDADRRSQEEEDHRLDHHRRGTEEGFVGPGKGLGDSLPGFGEDIVLLLDPEVADLADEDTDDKADNRSHDGKDERVERSVTEFDPVVLEKVEDMVSALVLSFHVLKDLRPFQGGIHEVFPVFVVQLGQRGVQLCEDAVPVVLGDADGDGKLLEEGGIDLRLVDRVHRKAGIGVHHGHGDGIFADDRIGQVLRDVHEGHRVVLRRIDVGRPVVLRPVLGDFVFDRAKLGDETDAFAFGGVEVV